MFFWGGGSDKGSRCNLASNLQRSICLCFSSAGIKVWITIHSFIHSLVYFMCVSVLPSCMYIWDRRGHQAPRTGVSVYELPCGSIAIVYILCILGSSPLFFEIVLWNLGIAEDNLELLLLLHSSSNC